MKNAIAIIHGCAPQYAELTKRDYLFIFSDGGKNTQHIEMDFQPKHFLHLTGIIYAGGSPTDFFTLAMEQHLLPEQLTFKEGVTAKLKLQVLPQLVALPATARKIGRYNHSRPQLQADAIAGSSHACMAISKDPTGKYYPRSALNEKPETLCDAPLHDIVATLSKDRGEKLYSRAEYINTKIDTRALCLSPELQAKIDPILICPAPTRTNPKTPGSAPDHDSSQRGR